MFNNSNNGYSLADIAAATGNGYNNNNNDGFGFGGNGGAWIFLLFILFLVGGWNNNNGFGGGNGGGGTTFVANDIQRGFDQATLTSGITGLSTGMCNGFAGVQQALCSGFAGVNGNMANGFAQAEIANNARQIADMNQNFASQTALLSGINNLQGALQQCLNAIGTCAA